jgi:hypothetical protein
LTKICENCGIETDDLYTVKRSLRVFGINHIETLEVCINCKRNFIIDEKVEKKLAQTDLVKDFGFPNNVPKSLKLPKDGEK